MSWRTCLDLDLTAQGNQTLSSDTTYTIGGITWTKTNSMNDRVALALTNGTGLVFNPIHTAGVDYDSASGAIRTAPLLWTPLSSLAIPNLDWSTKLRFWINIAADTVDADTYPSFEGVFAGFDNGLSSGSTNWWRVAIRGVGTAGVCGVGLKSAIAGSQTPLIYNMKTSPTTTTWGALNHPLVSGVNNILVCEMTGADNGQKTLFGTSSATTWPSPSILNPANSYQEGSSVGYNDSVMNLGSNHAANVGIGSLIGLVFGTYNNNGASTYSATISRIRVDYWA